MKKTTIPCDTTSLIHSLNSLESKQILMQILSSNNNVERFTEQKRIKRPSQKIVEAYDEYSSDEDVYAGENDEDGNFILEKEYSSSSDSDMSLECVETSSLKKKIEISSESKKKESGLTTIPKKNIKSALLTLNDAISKLSHSVSALQQEFKLLTEFPKLHSPVPSQIINKRPSFPMGCDDFTFSLKTESVTVPIREKEKVSTMDSMLQNVGIYSHVVIFSVFYTSRIRNIY